MQSNADMTAPAFNDSLNQKSTSRGSDKKKVYDIKQLEEEWESYLEALREDDKKKNISQINFVHSNIHEQTMLTKQKRLQQILCNQKRNDFAHEVATQRNSDNMGYDKKFRQFQLCKWDILKRMKAQMLSERIAAINKSRGLCHLVMVCTVIQAIKRAYWKFDREREVRKILKRKIFFVGIMKAKFLAYLKNFGPTPMDRKQRWIVNALTSVELSRKLEAARATE